MPELPTPQVAARLAGALLSPLGDRWAHTRAVAARARQLADAVPSDARELLEVAAWWHDLGYATDLVQTGMHQIDGARFLEDMATDVASTGKDAELERPDDQTTPDRRGNEPALEDEADQFEKTMPEPRGAEDPDRDIREDAADEHSQVAEDDVRVPSAEETAAATERAHRALAEIRAREEADAQEAAEHRAEELARWHADDQPDSYQAEATDDYDDESVVSAV